MVLQEERNGTNFSFVASASEEFYMSAERNCIKILDYSENFDSGKKGYHGGAEWHKFVKGIAGCHNSTLGTHMTTFYCDNGR